MVGLSTQKMRDGEDVAVISSWVEDLRNTRHAQTRLAEVQERSLELEVDTIGEGGVSVLEELLWQM